MRLLIFLSLIFFAANAMALENSNFFYHLKKPHEVRLIDDGSLSLGLRLQEIESANESIYLEYFYFEPDQAGRLILQALVKKKLANPNIKIKILVDRWGSENFNLELSSLLSKYQMEVRYFNTSTVTNFETYNHRDHRKLFIIDGKRAIVGGNNISAENFGMNQGYNLLDREILISGEIVSAIQNSFTYFWEHYCTEKLENYAEYDNCELGDQVCFGRWLNAKKALRETQKDLEILATLKKQTTENTPQSLQVQSIHFISDQPELGATKRLLTPYIHWKLKHATKNLLIESAHFIPSKKKLKILKNLLEKNIAITILSNSLKSTSSFDFTSMIYTYEKIMELLPSGATIYGLSGELGTHSKSFIIDDQSTFIGTYNWDARSENLNIENGIFIEDETFAKLVKDSIERRIANQSQILNQDGTYGPDHTDHWSKLPFTLQVKRAALLLLQPILEPFH